MPDHERRESNQDADDARSFSRDGERERDGHGGAGDSRGHEDDWRHERERGPLTDNERRERWPLGQLRTRDAGYSKVLLILDSCVLCFHRPFLT